MDIYLKGYYGYQNLGDELLLLGLLNWIEDEYRPSTIYIESGDPHFLADRLKKCKKFVKTDNDNIVCVSKADKEKKKGAFKIFGGGEVVSDARKIPRNGWNYLLGFLSDIISRNYAIFGGIGTPKKRGTSWLYRYLLGRAQRIVVRDATSYTIANKYSTRTELYHDFCYDLLRNVIPRMGLPKPYIIVNVNVYLWNQTIVDTIRQVYDQYPSHDIYFLPAARGSDDTLLKELKEIFPEIHLLDRRISSVENIVGWVAGADHVLAARLHVLLLASWAEVPFTPFVYQEKIEKCLLQGNTITRSSMP